MAENKEQVPLYHGSCHCGYITYEARIDLTNNKECFKGKSVISKCNCSICHKLGAPLVPPEDGSFKILTPETGREGMKEYTFGAKNVHRYFCPNCGIQPLVEGSFEFDGKPFTFQRINVLTIDKRADGQPMEDLRKVKVGYYSGKDDDWSKPIADTPYEGGPW